VAIAAGAGRPTIIDITNNLIRGIRKASDFLMALQLTGAFKKDALRTCRRGCRRWSSAAASPASTPPPS
jgi:NADPH-dependent glutamate synthase beta subunit-like oxidoreductase